jgi:hypothetical protein
VKTLIAALAIVGLTSLAEAQPSITNYHCKPAILDIFQELNEKAVAALTRPTVIYAIHCYFHGEIQVVLLRAGDGRLMEWTPSKGSNELKHMMLFGREPR